jgi:hypothetical protein
MLRNMNRNLSLPARGDPAAAKTGKRETMANLRTELLFAYRTFRRMDDDNFGGVYGGVMPRFERMPGEGSHGTSTVSFALSPVSGKSSV